ncbi:MAG: DUF1906 domain-containing protein [Anaerolineaceae bacterium]|nr:DUF1906 domain-containing protein [Anaerolineaceae bacterium]
MTTKPNKFFSLAAILLLAFVLMLSACTTKLAKPVAEAPKPSTVSELKAAGLELAEQPERLPDLQYDLFSPGNGWLGIDTRLFRTPDNGKAWDEMSAGVPDGYTLGSISFLDENHIWALYTAKEGFAPAFLFFASNDGGKTWNQFSKAFNAVLNEKQLVPDGKVFIQRLTPQIGWVLIKQATGANFSTGLLLKTIDGGSSWSLLNAPAGEKFIFADEGHSFMLKGPNDVSLYSSSDGGQTWNELGDLPKTDGAEMYRVGLPDFQANGYGVFALFAYKGDTLLKTTIMQTNDYGKTWSVGAEDPGEVQQAPGSEPYYQLLTDGNLSRWSRIPSASNSLSAQDQNNKKAQIVALSASGTNDAWGTFVSGFCHSQLVVGQDQLHCSQDQLLGFTTDGGKTWQPLPLPIAITKDSKSIFNKAAEAKSPLGVGGKDPAQMKAVNPTVKVAVGQGFDQCEIPSNASLDAWRDSSPYTVVNLYIGGSARACSNNALTYNKVSYLYNNGWTFIPTWVGPQAPCSNFRSKMSPDPAVAYQQGLDNANQAMSKMYELGLTDANGNGGVVYYDLEYYVGDSSCQTAVRSFFEGWNARLHQMGAVSGVYGASCHYWSTNKPPQNLSNLVGLNNPLDAVWVAKYIETPYYYNSTVGVWGIASCFPDSLWNQNQRLRQYTGGHNETWGGYTINIDSNVLLGPVAYPAIGDTIPPQTQLSFSGTPGENGYYKSGGNISLSAEDRQSGLKATYYQINDGAKTIYTAPFPLNENRDYKITYYSEDNKGNMESPKTALISIDTAAPTLAVALKGDIIGNTGWYGSPVTLDIKAADNFSGVAGSQYNINGGAWVDLPTGQTALLSVNGQNMNLGVRSKDKAGNLSAVVYNKVSIDTEAPANPSYADPHCQAVNNLIQGFCNDPDFTWHNAYDNGSGLKLYEYYWGPDPNGSHASGQNPASDNHFDPGPVADASVTYLRIRVQDNLGKWSQWKTIFTLRYDSRFTNHIFMPLVIN